MRRWYRYYSLTVLFNYFRYYIDLFVVLDSFYLTLVLQLAGDRVHSSLLDASTASLSAESKFCKVISFESITMSMSERLVKSTLSMGPLLFRLQLSIVLHTESENILCGSIRSDGDITCCFPAPSHSSSSSVTASTWIGSGLTAESFADLTRKGNEHMQRIADLLQQNVLRSNRRFFAQSIEIQI